MYHFYFTNFFKSQLKPYLKKHTDLLQNLIASLKQFNRHGLISLGNHLYKTRISTSSINKGKSASFRLILFIDEETSLIAPVMIYSKNRFSNLNKKELKRCLKKVIEELEF